MQKLMTSVLISLLAFTLPCRTAFASSTAREAKRTERVRLQVENLVPGMSVRVKLRDHQQIEGDFVARSEGGFELATPEPLTIGYAEVKDVSGTPAGQSNSGSSQSSARHHGHFLRNALIGVAVFFGLAIVIAVAAK